MNCNITPNAIKEASTAIRDIQEKFGDDAEGMEMPEALGQYAVDLVQKAIDEKACNALLLKVSPRHGCPVLEAMCPRTAGFWPDCVARFSHPYRIPLATARDLEAGHALCVYRAAT